MARRPRDTSILKQFGQRLRDVRLRAGKTQQEVAELVGVRPATVSQFEVGAMAPTLGTVAMLARALGAKVADFFTFDESPEAPISRADPTEIALLEAFRGLDRDKRALVLATAKALNVGRGMT